MTNDKASIREVYTLVKESSDNSDKRFDELQAMFEAFHKEEFQPLKESVDKFKAYAVVVVFILSIIGSIIGDWVKKNILHI